MSGLIWGGIGKGMADAGSTAGQMMFKSAADEENRQWKEEQNAMYRRAVGPAGGGAGGGGAISFKDLGEGGAAEENLAGLSGMSVPEMRDISRRTKEGDYSVSQKVTTLDDNEGEVTQDVKSYPAGFEQEVKDKAKELAKLRESQVLAGKYGDVAKGRQTMQEVKGTEDILSGKKSAGVVGTAIAGGQGKDLYSGDSNVTRQKFTGETGTTDVGKSQITENIAQAGKANADASKALTEKVTNSDRLTTVINSANQTIKSLNEGSRGTTSAEKAEWKRQMDDAIAIRDQATSQLKSRMSEKETPKPEPKSDNKPPQNKPPMLDALPQGARKIGTKDGKDVYETPDGRRFIKN